MRPQGFEKGTQRLQVRMKRREQRQRFLAVGAPLEIAGEHGPCGEIACHLLAWISCSKDRKTRHERSARPGRSFESLRGKMQSRHRMPGTACVLCRSERRPRDRLAIEVDARRRCMNFVGPCIAFNNGLAGFRREYAWNRCAVGPKILEEPMLLVQPFAIAHNSRMALHEDTFPAAANHARRRKGPWTHRNDFRRPIASRKFPQYSAHFACGKRRPVGLDEAAIHSMCHGHCADCLGLLGHPSFVKTYSAQTRAQLPARLDE